MPLHLSHKSVQVRTSPLLFRTAHTFDSHFPFTILRFIPVLTVLAAILTPLMLNHVTSFSRHFLPARKPKIMGAATEPTVPTAISAKQGLGTATSNGAGSVTDVATVASGCFWGTEHIFREHYGSGRGLVDAKVGFIGGKESSKDPSYEEVCTGRTGHAEATQIMFDPVSKYVTRHKLVIRSPLSCQNLT